MGRTYSLCRRSRAGVFKRHGLLLEDVQEMVTAFHYCKVNIQRGIIYKVASQILNGPPLSDEHAGGSSADEN